jgi:peptidoglycan/xylan/chitin deacetylase (PgdA/CDA1 family)
MHCNTRLNTSQKRNIPAGKTLLTMGWSKFKHLAGPMARGAALACALAAGGLPGAAMAAESAVVFMYHRFGEGNYPATNIRIEQFEAHIQELKSGAYNVRPLAEIVAALRKGETLPDNTVAVSIDDAFASVYREAWPRLRDAGIPFTLFVATGAVDRATPDYMTWDQIRELAKGGVTIGSQTATHLHMARASRERNLSDLANSNVRFVKELGAAPKMIAYPYGEYSLAVGAASREAGFEVGFGQHSGVVHKGEDFFFLPRFAFNESYGDVGRFRLAARALPLPVSDVTPRDPLLKAETNPPPFGFTVTGEAVKGLSRLACYYSAEGKLRVERLGEARIEVRIEVRTENAFPQGRSRINCTMPARDGRWRWYGRQFYVAPTR